MFDSSALKLKMAINAQLWNETMGAYSDNPANGNLFPQDGNSMAVWFNVTRVPSDKVRILAYLKSNWNNIGSVSPEWKYNGQNAIGTFPSSIEVLARLAADLHTVEEEQGDGPRYRSTTNDGIDLIKRTWGYMLNCKNSTESTFWEGFVADGQFAFNGIYMSHAHGWATGPAPALTHYLVGIHPLVARTHNKEGGVLYFHYTVSPQILNSGVQFVNGSLAFDHTGTMDDRCSISVGWKNDSRQVTIVLDTTSLRQNYIGKVGIQFHGQLNILMRTEVARKGDGDSDIAFEARQSKAVRLTPQKYKYGERVWFRNIKSGFRHVFQYDIVDR